MDIEDIHPSGCWKHLAKVKPRVRGRPAQAPGFVKGGTARHFPQDVGRKG